MNISKDYRTIVIIALTEYKSRLVGQLLDFAERYRDSSNDSGTLLQCMFNCVHLYEKAEKALKEIGGKK